VGAAGGGWSQTYPTAHPIFADVDGDGRGEFLVCTADGRLKCIGQKGAAEPAAK